MKLVMGAGAVAVCVAVLLSVRITPVVPGAGLADPPAALVPVAEQAGRLTGASPDVLLAIAKVECHFGRCQAGQPDGMVPADVRAVIDAGALAPGGPTATMLGLPDGRRIGDWVNPKPVGREHAMGFMQFLPSTWREEAAAAPGGPRDPYKPFDSMVVAGSYLQRLQAGVVDGRRRSLREAVAVYGGGDQYADEVLGPVR